MNNRKSIFLTSVFFVLGFSLIFSILGVLLQTTLQHVSSEVQIWLSRLGGAFIIFFGLYLIGLIQPSFLQKEYKFQVKHKFNSTYLTSFIFGAAFAVGWTPCVGAILGAILSLAVTQPSSAFILLFAYTLGLGIPFLIVGAFTTQVEGFLEKSGKWLHYLNIIFGIMLIIIGILIFTSQLSRIANLQIASEILIKLNLQSIAPESSLNIGIAFLAGLISFFSPCVLPIIPGFLTFLASNVTKNTLLT